MSIEAKKNTIPAHLGLLVLTASLGPQLIVAASKIGENAEQFIWLSALLGGMISFISAYMILKICLAFPENTFIEIINTLLGKTGGLLVLIHFMLLLISQLILSVRILTNTIHLFLFDRTPPEVILLVFIIAAMYIAMQEWNTQLGVIQFFSITQIPLLFGLWMLCLLNFHAEYLLPLWPEKPFGILLGAIDSLNIFTGHALLFILFSLLNTTKKGVIKAAVWGIGTNTLMYVINSIILVGVLTPSSIKALPYPTIIALKGVELPRIFIERIENYMLLTWTPVIMMMFVLFLFCLSEALRQKLKLREHCMLLPVWLPIIFIIIKMIETPYLFYLFYSAAKYINLLFSFFTVPLLWILSKKRMQSKCITTKNSL
jgi:spore germination protein